MHSIFQITRSWIRDRGAFGAAFAAMKVGSGHEKGGGKTNTERKYLWLM